MRDLQHKNPAAMTGTPTLVTGPLTAPGDQGLSFNGTTNSMTVPDSPSSSLAIADGGAGGMALVTWIRFSSLPGVQKSIIAKSGSYDLGITATNRIYFTLTNGASSVTVTALDPVVAGAWTHVAAVYNGDYTGPAVFGKNTVGATMVSLQGDYRAGAPTGAANLQVCRFQALERGVLTNVTMDLAIDRDAPSSQDVAAVVYADDNGAPGAKLAQSAGKLLSPSDVPLTTGGGRAWYPFPVTAAIYGGEFYWLGYAGGAIHAADPTVLVVGSDTTGGVHRGKTSVVSESDSGPASQSVADPFGTASLSDANNLAVYANYQDQRTGDEGHALIYLNGRVSNSASYTHGIADTANATVFASGTAVQLARTAILDRKLIDVEVAFLYSAR